MPYSTFLKLLTFLVYYSNPTWVFPVSFSSSPNVFVSSSNMPLLARVGTSGSLPPYSNASLEIDNLNNQAAQVNLIAIGRWTNSTNINTPDVSTWGLDSSGNIVQVNASRNVNVTSIGGNFMMVVENEPRTVMPKDSITANVWTNRTLNNVTVNEIAGASLNANNISVTLPIGTYYIEGAATIMPAQSLVIISTARIYDTTHNVNLTFGQSNYDQVATGSAVFKNNLVTGRFTLTSISNISLQQIMSNVPTQFPFGLAANFTTETYSMLKIWKVG